MTNVDLNKMNMLTDKTYLTDKDTWRDYDGNFYESPFNKQTSYGQRYNSKNFAKSEMPDEAHNWYEPRQVLGADLSQTKTELGEDELPYHDQFPRYNPRTSETFYTKPFASGQGHAHDVYTSSIPASGPEVPNFVETFKVGKKHFSIAAVVIVILLIIILLATGYYVYRRLNGYTSCYEQTMDEALATIPETETVDDFDQEEDLSPEETQMFGGKACAKKSKKNKKPKKKMVHRQLFEEDWI